MTVVDFDNFTYHVNPCKQNVPVDAVVRHGFFNYFDEKMGAGFTIHVETVARGELAGTPAAVVTLACDFPIGGTAAAYLFVTHGNSATLVSKVADANWGADWGAGPSSISAKFDRDVLTVVACADTQCNAFSSTRYTLSGGKLTTLSTQTIPRQL